MKTVKNGTFTGTGAGVKGIVKVETVFYNNRIMSVTVKEHHEVYGMAWGLKTSPIEVIPMEIVKSQSLGVEPVDGVKETCKAILDGVADCVTQAGGDAQAWRNAPVPAAPKAADETVEVDILVAGGGAAGLAAGIEALELGVKNVVLIEKNGITGGSTARSGGKLVAADTKWQKRQGIYDTPEMLFDYLKEVGGDMLHDDKMRLFCQHSYETMLWLEGMGYQVKDVEAIHKSLTPWRVHNSPNGGGMTDGQGGEITAPMTYRFEDLGGTILYKTALKSLITDEKGTVCGVKAVRKDGSVLTVKAKAVILGTGGYSHNKEMMARYPEAEGYKSQAPSGNVGDGLIAAEQIGARVFNHPTTQVVYCSFTCGVGINEESGLIVNKWGQRVVNEWTYQYHVADAIAKTGSNLGYYICDANDPNPTVKYGISLDSEIKANSPEELAEKIGMDPKTLADTVKRYNALCQQGSDLDFGKPADKMIPVTGPVYCAIVMKPAISVTYGGLESDTNGRTLDGNGNPIPGLYSAGEVAGTGLYGRQYPCCGTSIGTALFYGRMAARHAVQEYIK